MLFLSAIPRSLRTVRVKFDDVPDASAFIASNYTFTAQVDIDSAEPRPAAAVSCSLVLEVDGATDEADLVVDDDLSPLATYLITGTGITDLTAPDNTIAFEAKDTDSPATRDFSLFDLVPQFDWTLDDNKDLYKFIACLEDLHKLHLHYTDNWTSIFDVDYTEEQYLDAMLADFANPFAFDLTELEKRRLVALMIPIAKQKGTGQGIINVIRLFTGLEVTLIPTSSIGLSLGTSLLGVDWVLGGSDVWRVIVKVPDSGDGFFDATLEKKIKTIIDYMKPAEEIYYLEGALPAPLNLDVTAPVEGGLQVTWDPPAEGVPESYNLYWKTTEGVTPYNATKVENAVSPYEPPDVPAGQTRYFIVVAVDALGHEGFPSNEDSDTTEAATPTPPSLPSGMLLHLDASVEADNIDIDTGTVINGWLDRSGEGNDFTNAGGGAARPNWIAGQLNGLGVVRFAQASVQYLAAPAFRSGTEPAEMIMLCKTTSAPGVAGGQHWFGSPNPFSMGDHYPFSDNNIYNGWGSGTRKGPIAQNPAGVVHTWHYYNPRSDAALWELFINAVSQHSVADTPAWTTTFELGRSHLIAALAWEADVAEVLMFDHVLSGAERTQVFDYLNAKWGV